MTIILTVINYCQFHHYSLLCGLVVTRWVFLLLGHKFDPHQRDSIVRVAWSRMAQQYLVIEYLSNVCDAHLLDTGGID